MHRSMMEGSTGLLRSSRCRTARVVVRTWSTLARSILLTSTFASPAFERLDLQECLAEPVDGEANAVAPDGELGDDAAAGHHDHAALESPSPAVEEIGHPGHRLEG